MKKRPRQNSRHKQTSALHFYTPRYWLYWLVLGCLRLLALLPYRCQLWLGKRVGSLMYRFSKKLRHIAAVNIELCFPDWTPVQRQVLLRDNFIASGIALFEAALACYASNKRIRPLMHLQGVEHIQAAQAEGRGVLLLGIHLLPFELVGRLFSLDHALHIIYRANKHAFLDFWLSRILRKHYAGAIERNDIRGLLRALREGKVVWYMHDIDAGYYDHVFVPFFGVPAASITATARLVAKTGAAVVPASFYRRDDGTGYDMFCYPKLENFPTDDIKADTAQVNHIAEEMIRHQPEQYLWQYKRFKTRPAGKKRFY